MPDVDPAQEIDALLTEVLERARTKRLGWRAESDQETFFFAIPSATVRLYPRDHDGMEPYVFEVLNEDGNVIGSVQSMRFQPSSQEWINHKRHEDIEALYGLARDDALKISRTFEMLRQALRDENVDADSVSGDPS